MYRYEYAYLHLRIHVCAYSCVYVQPSVSQAPNPLEGRPENCFLGGGGGGWHGRPAKEGGGGFQKWASVPGPLFCVRTDVATKGAGTQKILARKNFYRKKFSPTYV